MCSLSALSLCGWLLELQSQQALHGFTGFRIIAGWTASGFIGRPTFPKVASGHLWVRLRGINGRAPGLWTDPAGEVVL